ncbi:hypothetical protein [Streptomyces litchfieldiae]|uniref:Integral membrane protein n=1 Tax=Streptomyces litchfieldiae TaxID=3075543 RepID=A0ABU2MTW5_9ACTN|nr:hypothetical protein [Streptomyces sp. DSM 44938]MDT0344911.1 hypothetical protein [Streptomyces sp. DSM 44938]
MALLISEFPGAQPAGELVGDRLLDTLTGAACGLLAAALITHRRVGTHVQRLFARAESARADTERLLAAPAPSPAALEAAQHQLAHALTELGAATATAAGEWRRHPLPSERVARAERAGHRTLAAAVRQRTRTGSGNGDA